ncbi:MAG: UDP-3-O-(3-hydroxymyristoyl)glucosamine N-acyltransferase [Verrucomicrobiota bacterium]
MQIEITLEQIRERCAILEEKGDSEGVRLKGVATLLEAEFGDLSFLSSAKFYGQLESTKAAVVFVPEGTETDPKPGQVFLIAKNPSWEMARACESIATKLWPSRSPGIHESAVIDETSTIHEDVFIGPQVVVEAGTVIEEGCEAHAGAYIGENCILGKDTKILPNATIYRDTKIGAGSRIHSGVVIGADGFGLEFIQGSLQKVPQVGWVEIGEDVDIGANSCVDRGRLGPTRIGKGSRIDNHVQIGHNSQIGNHVTLCAQVGIAGTTTVEDYAVFGGRSGASGHITIGKGAQLAGCAVAFTDLDGGKKYGGLPAISLNAYQRLTIMYQRLPDVFKRLKLLETQFMDLQ